jgi:hypothetical protein
VKDLRRTVRKLEDELSKMKHADGGEKGSSSKSGTKKSSAAE